MSIFDFLKRKKEVEKSKKKTEKKVDKVLVGEKTGKKEKAISASKITESKKVSKDKRFSYEVVKEPHISEKSTDLAKDNKYVFKVYDGVNKKEIQKSISGIYRVDVLGVNIIKIPPKKRRIGKTQGFRKGYVKAIVKLKEGQKIEIL